MQQFLEKIEVEQKYTMVGMTEFGFPYSMNVKITKVINQPYAQYRESTIIYYIKKGKRKAQGIRVLPHNTLVIYKGWIEPKVDMFPDTSGISLGCFDRKYMKIAIDSVKNVPLIVYGVERGGN